jgi:hypothetical protein
VKSGSSRSSGAAGSCVRRDEPPFGQRAGLTTSTRTPVAGVLHPVPDQRRLSRRPEHPPAQLGIALTAISIGVMFWLAPRQARHRRGAWEPRADHRQPPDVRVLASVGHHPGWSGAMLRSRPAHRPPPPVLASGRSFLMVG